MSIFGKNNPIDTGIFKSGLEFNHDNIPARPRKDDNWIIGFNESDGVLMVAIALVHNTLSGCEHYGLH